MSSRWIRIALALGWFVLASIVIPAHTRGAIPINGASCCRQSDCGSSGTDSGSDSKAPQPQRSNCAICLFAAHLMSAISLPVSLEPGEFVAQQPITTIACPDFAHPDRHLPTRGPPAAA